MNKNAYKYIANNEGSYKELAAKVASTKANVSLYPALLTIVIVPNEECENVIGEIGFFIDYRKLDFTISPIEVHKTNFLEMIECPSTDVDTLREIARKLLKDNSEISKTIEKIDFDRHEAIEEITKQKAQAIKEKESYQALSSTYYKRLQRINGQLKAFSVLIGSVCQDN